MNNSDNQVGDTLEILLQESQYFHESVIANSRSLDTKGSILHALLGVLLIPVLSEQRILFSISTSFLNFTAVINIIGYTV